MSQRRLPYPNISEYCEIPQTRPKKPGASTPTHRPPWWKPPRVVINNTPEEDIWHHEKICAKAGATYVYTDGSGIGKHIGAAAIVLSTPGPGDNSVLQKRTQYVGSETKSIVYIAELTDILLTLQILNVRLDFNSGKAVIFTDNQSALKTVRHPQYTLE